MRNRTFKCQSCNVKIEVRQGERVTSASNPGDVRHLPVIRVWVTYRAVCSPAGEHLDPLPGDGTQWEYVYASSCADAPESLPIGIDHWGVRVAKARIIAAATLRDAEDAAIKAAQALAMAHQEQVYARGEAIDAYEAEVERICATFGTLTLDD